MNVKVPGTRDFPALFAEINRLRRKEGLEPVGALGFAQKLVSHFHESKNARVAEALRNIGLSGACPAE
ncbi:hypothetical protein L0Y65_01945 [Candidatus Micrarchaeota archaeon]|nr:hypothetical protein [Candidatus Micrarchaeota archaeon]